MGLPPSPGGPLRGCLGKRIFGVPELPAPFSSPMRQSLCSEAKRWGDQTILSEALNPVLPQLPFCGVRQSELDFAICWRRSSGGGCCLHCMIHLVFRTAPGVGEISPILQMRKSEAQKVHGQRLHSELGGGRPWNLAFSNSLPITHVVKRIFCNLEARRASSDSLFTGSEVSGSTPGGTLSLRPVPSAFPHRQTQVWRQECLVFNRCLRPPGRGVRGRGRTDSLPVFGRCCRRRRLIHLDSPLRPRTRWAAGPWVHSGDRRGS